MHCNKRGAEALQSSRFFILIFICLVLMMASSGHAQTREAAQAPRQIWIKLKAGPVLTGDLVKIDSDSVDFKVKGVLQSVKTDEVAGVTFAPPSAISTTAPQPGPQPQPTQPVPVPQASPMQEIAPAQFDRRLRRSVQLGRGQSKQELFGSHTKDFRYTGDFKVVGGKASVYIVDNENLTKLTNRKKFEAFYAASKVTEGKFEIFCQKETDYHLVFWNESNEAILIEANIFFAGLDQ